MSRIMLFAGLALVGTAPATPTQAAGGMIGTGGPNAVAPNGVKQNGVNINGIRRNGVKHNGIERGGVATAPAGPATFAPADPAMTGRARGHVGLLLAGLLAAAPATAETVRSVAVEGTAFRITLADGRVLAQEELLGAVLVAADESGKSLTVRIDGFEPDPKDPTGETILYSLSTPDGAGGWTNACGPGPDGRQQGFPLRGRWNDRGEHIDDPSQLSITCTAGAIGKCVRAGYRPWAQASDGTAMWELHQACVRLFRADYCGDGYGHTRDGTLVDVWDRHGIQVPGDPEGMRFEAAFDKDGALCVARPRLEDVATLAEIEARCPGKLAGRTGAACAGPEAAAAQGAVLFVRSR